MTGEVTNSVYNSIKLIFTVIKLKYAECFNNILSEYGYQQTYPLTPDENLAIQIKANLSHCQRRTINSFFLKMKGYRIFSGNHSVETIKNATATATAFMATDQIDATVPEYCFKDPVAVVFNTLKSVLLISPQSSLGRLLGDYRECIPVLFGSDLGQEEMKTIVTTVPPKEDCHSFTEVVACYEGTNYLEK